MLDTGKNASRKRAIGKKRTEGKAAIGGNPKPFSKICRGRGWEETETRMPQTEVRKGEQNLVSQVLDSARNGGKNAKRDLNNKEDREGWFH